MKITAATSLEDLLANAKQSLKDVEQGEVFLVKDLFRGFEWNRIPVGNRTKLGSMFLNYSQHEGNGSLEKLDKTPQNQQKYKKI
ncbi:single-stranded DNA-binding protein [Bacillus luti]|nr:single-stranded DNA-binding protein [Bacillus cereus]HDR8327243.1 single-stranded DNA-binding protein [Bacillus cereus]HDR8336433.1 single-stranded DNA-binding protein [Bacillus cereus]